MHKRNIIQITALLSALSLSAQVAYDSSNILIDLGSAANPDTGAATLNDGSAATWNVFHSSSDWTNIDAGFTSANALNDASGDPSGISVSFGSAWSVFGGEGNYEDLDTYDQNPAWLTSESLDGAWYIDASDVTVDADAYMTFSGLTDGQEYTLYTVALRHNGDPQTADPSIIVGGSTDDTFTIWDTAQAASGTATINSTITGTFDANANYTTANGGGSLQFLSMTFTADSSGEAVYADLGGSFPYYTQFTLAAVPEPSSYAAILGALALSAVMVTRRRK